MGCRSFRVVFSNFAVSSVDNPKSPCECRPFSKPSVPPNAASSCRFFGSMRSYNCSGVKANGLSGSVDGEGGTNVVPVKKEARPACELGRCPSAVGGASRLGEA